jgi:16S rRNA C1402 (ribose-2'-O) methylase RsmI
MMYVGRKPFRLLFPILASTRIILFDCTGTLRASHFITNSYLFKGQFQPWNRHRTGSRRCALNKTNTFVIQEPSGRLIIHALSHLNYTAKRRRVVNCRAVVKIALGLLIAADLIYIMQYQLSHLKYIDASK